MWQRCDWSHHGEYEITCELCGDIHMLFCLNLRSMSRLFETGFVDYIASGDRQLISNNSKNWRRRWIYYVIWQFVSSIGSSTTPIPRWAFWVLCRHFFRLDIFLLSCISLPRLVLWFCWRECRLCGGAAEGCIWPPTKWQSKTVSDDHKMAIENCQYKTLSLSKRLTILCFVIERWIGK